MQTVESSVSSNLVLIAYFLTTIFIPKLTLLITYQLGTDMKRSYNSSKNML